MFTVIGQRASRTFRVLWALEELGLPYTHQPEAPRSSLVSKYNPSGKVPILLEGEAPMLDSVAIIQYLADSQEKLTFPAGTPERARQDSFTQFGGDELDAALWTAAKNSFIHPKDLRVPAIKPTLKWEFERSLSVLAERMASNTYVMGDAFTVPDIVIGHCLRWADMAKFPLQNPPINAYFDRIKAREAYQAAELLP